LNPRLKTISDYLRPEITTIFDARSPAEYELDHIPGAINWPVLDNAQRAEVGLLYKTDAFAAKKLGARYVTQNISAGIDVHVREKDPAFCPLIYCWRGGQRSLSLATILSQIGWQSYLLEGGYKNYRARVREQLDQRIPAFTFVSVSGLTGTAKTKILGQMESVGEQVLDLESLANHRGSLLGAHEDTPQPSQKFFEGQLMEKILQFDAGQIIWLESESNKIGNLQIPVTLWKMMQRCQQVEIQASLDSRADFILQDYRALTENPALLQKKLQFIKHRIAKTVYSEWMEAIESEQWRKLVMSLLENHYDPSYRRSLKNNQRETIQALQLANFDKVGYKKMAQALVKHKPHAIVTSSTL